MSHLQDEQPEVYHHFQAGLHVVRRTDRYWAGLSSDLVIEQVLMKSIKTSGGLTRGRGMTEQQRLIWLLSMPACAEINRVMLELTGVSYSTSEQNKDMTKARQDRDWKDTQTLLKYLHERNPFTSEDRLHSISTGVHASSSVNVDAAKDVGNTILASMEGISAADYTFKRKNQVFTLDTKCVVRIDGVAVQIDPQLLFQRLTIAAKVTESQQDIFKYELCGHPPALFDASLLLWEPQKPVLANAIWDLVSSTTPAVLDDVQYVLDGGALIQRIPWTHGATYHDITVYSDYVAKKYGSSIIVFNGYGESSTKDIMHLRRTKGQVGVNVAFTEEMQFTMKKETFLANSSNKEQFINMLSGS